MRKSKTYRMDKNVLEKIEWLRHRLGGLSATSVIAVAVSELFERTKSNMRARISPVDNSYVLSVDNVPIMEIDEATLEGMGAYRDQLLSKEGADADSWFIAILSANKAGASLNFNQENLEKLFGPVYAEDTA